MEYTGFDQSKDFSFEKSITNVEKITLVDSSAQFSEELITGREAWQITFKDIRICSKSDEMVPGIKYPDEYKVYIDYKTGKLLKIESNFVITKRENYRKGWESEVDSMLCKPMNMPGRFLGLPDNIPKLSFYEVIQHPNTAEPPHVRKYIAYSIKYKSNFEENTIDTWYIIMMEGVGVLSFADPKYYKEHYSHMAIGVAIKDSNTGLVAFFRMKGYPAAVENEEK